MSIWGVVFATVLYVVALEYSLCPPLRKRQRANDGGGGGGVTE